MMNFELPKVYWKATARGEKLHMLQLLYDRHESGSIVGMANYQQLPEIFYRRQQLIDRVFGVVTIDIRFFTVSYGPSFDRSCVLKTYSQTTANVDRRVKYLVRWTT